MKRGLFLFFVFCAISNAYAQMECESIPSCAEMGYTQDSCAGGKGIRCPFDETKFYCAGAKQLPDAPDPVIMPEDWTAECADKVDHCTTYNADCKCTACEDDYNLADNTCVSKCDKSVATCAAENKIFKEETCTCEACPENYQFNSETKTCERIACNTKKVSNCTSYSSVYEPCSCKTCETNYLLEDGKCKKMCVQDIENCTRYNTSYDPCDCTACEDGFVLCVKKCHVVTTCAEKCLAYAGQENTKAAINQIANEALAAYAASQFYVGDKTGDFGQGKWYLPSIGEWLEFYAPNIPAEDIFFINHLVNSTAVSRINRALNALVSKGVEASSLSGNYWSSSEYSIRYVWILKLTTGNYASWNYTSKSQTLAVRSFLLLKDCYNPVSGETAPKIGDVMYEDKTWGSATDYDGSKKVVGVIANVSVDGRDVTIINLKDLTFSSWNKADNFDPENPYGGSTKVTYWSKLAVEDEDITEIPNFDVCRLLKAIHVSDNCSCSE